MIGSESALFCKSSTSTTLPTRCCALTETGRRRSGEAVNGPIAVYSLADLAERHALQLRGDGRRRIDGVATLARATPSQIGFLANPRYRAELAQSRAGAVIVREADAAGHDGDVLIAGDPYVAFAKIAALFEPAGAAPAGIHATAVVSADARVARGASIGPFCVVDAGTSIEDGATLGPHCHVGEDCVDRRPDISLHA